MISTTSFTKRRCLLALLWGTVVIVSETQSSPHPSSTSFTQFTRHTAQTLGDFVTHFQIPKFEIAGLVFELDLIAVLENFTYATATAVEAKDLRPGIELVEEAQPWSVSTELTNAVL